MALRVITLSAKVPSDAGIGCLAQSFGPTQVEVLMSCNTGFGRLDGSHFTPLPSPSEDYILGGAAW